MAKWHACAAFVFGRAECALHGTKSARPNKKNEKPDQACVTTRKAKHTGSKRQQTPHSTKTKPYNVVHHHRRMEPPTTSGRSILCSAEKRSSRSTALRCHWRKGWYPCKNSNLPSTHFHKGCSCLPQEQLALGVYLRWHSLCRHSRNNRHCRRSSRGPERRCKDHRKVPSAAGGTGKQRR